MDQLDAARLEAERHSDPEVLKEMAEWMELCRPKETYPLYPADIYPEDSPYLNAQSEDTNS